MDLTRVNLNLFTIFQCLMQHRTLTEAADSMYLSQSALSHSLKQLRTMLNDQLFVSTNKGLVPTEKAKLIYPKVEAALQSYHQILNMEEGWSPATLNYTFKIGLSGYTSYSLLPRLHERLETVAPNASVHVEYLSYNNKNEIFQDDSIDLVVANSTNESKFSVNSNYENVYCEKIVCVAGKASEVIGTKLTFESFEHIKLIKLMIYDDYPKFVTIALNKHKIQAHRSLYTPLISSIPKLLANFNYVAFLPESMAKELKQLYKIKIYKTPFETPNAHTYLYTHNTSINFKERSWIREQVKEIYQEIKKEN